MSGLAVDTLAYMRRLEGAGFTRAQAEALADEQAKLIVDRLATKADIARIEAGSQAQKTAILARLDADRAASAADADKLRSSLAHDMERLRLTLKADVAETFDAFRADMLKWMLGLLGFQTVVVVAALFGSVRTLVR